MSRVARALNGLREWNESPGEEDVRSAETSSGRREASVSYLRLDLANGPAESILPFAKK